jgi:anaerobic magnesium-protoporphyrin IX monomethyl ester cyclase
VGKGFGVRMKIALVSLEDGITACGFRKFAARAAELNEDTTTYYVSTSRWATVRGAIKGTMGDQGDLTPSQIDEIVAGLRDSDLVGFSSMTGYAKLTHQIIERLRESAPEVYIVWGGIHPIIHPEDAILAPVDAICTGEGEFAFEKLLARLEAGERPDDVKNFWFRTPDGEVKKNGFLPLMTSAMMEELPFPSYGAPGEQIYRLGHGFEDMHLDDYLANDGLSYTALWSIGCPFHCTYCGNTAFIANDKSYKKIRHPSARYIVEEVKAVRERFPHLSQVSFLDDSFMAIQYRELEEFAELWHDELGLPFAVYGVIPNYVKQDKFEILTWAGMNRVRMGIQSGSKRILDFYQRPSPPPKILAAGKIIASFSPKYHIPPAYDIIMDNPIETRQDVVDTLELLYEMPRPYTLLIYSLKVIPNTELARAMEEEGIDLEAISSSYLWIPPRAANLLLYLLAIVRPPRWLFDRLLKHVRASAEEQKEYPRIGMVLRTGYLAKRALQHLWFMDFSIIPGKGGYLAWRLGLVGLWQKKVRKRMERPARKPRPKREIVLPDVTVVPPASAAPALDSAPPVG